ncbi:MAG: transglutaminase domain-containing protein [Methanobacterium sp.]|jgi:hypothetical protein
MAVLLLSAIILPFGAGTAFATNNITNGTSNGTNPTINHNLTNVTDQTKTVANTTKAAGSPASVSFTSKQINTAAGNVTKFVQTNNRLPNYVTIGNVEVTMPQFLQLMTTNLLNINKGLNITVTIKTVTTPADPPETVKSGDIQKSEYLTLAQSIKSAGTAPGILNTTLGKINFQNTIYTFSKILNFQNINNRLPNFVSVKPWNTTVSTTTTTNTTTSNVQSILNAIGTAEAKYADVQGQSSASVMTQCGYGDCWADSSWLYEHLTAKGIESRIMEASNPSGLYYLHRWTEINIGNGWVVWDYAKYNSQHYGELGYGPFVVEEGS